MLLVIYATGEVAVTAEVVGQEALIPLPSAAEWSAIVNFRPGDRETVRTNPPRFSWSYTPDPTATNSDFEAKRFVFVLARSPVFATPISEITTNSNLYNYLAPLSPGDYYWKVGYIHDGVNSVYQWSNTRTFSVPATAPKWDRSLLADPAYMAGKGQHPHMLFNAGTRQALFNFLQDKEAKYLAGTSPVWEVDTGKGWNIAKHAAQTTIKSAWWPVAKPAGSVSSWAEQIANVGLVWQLTRDPAIANSNPQLAVVALARDYVASQ